MAQYRTIKTGYPLHLQSTGVRFRYRAEGGVLYIDELDGTWQEINSFTLPAVSRNVFRIGTRGGYFVYDQEIDATGFSGTIGVNWDNIEEHSLAEPTTSTTSTSSTTTTAP